MALGARFDLSPRAYADVAVDCRYQRNRVQAPGNPAAWDAGELTSWRSWSARARGFIAVDDVTVLTPVAEYLREDFGSPILNETWRTDTVMNHDNRLVRLGLALCWLPDPDRLLAVTSEYLEIRDRHTYLAGADSQLPQADHLSALSLRVAAEHRLNWWLSLRASLALTRIRNPDDFEDGSVTVPDGQYLDPAGGVALHLGRWGADLTAAGAPLPEPWRWLAVDSGADLWLRATLYRDF